MTSPTGTSPTPRCSATGIAIASSTSKQSLPLARRSGDRRGTSGSCSASSRTCSACSADGTRRSREPPSCPTDLGVDTDIVARACSPGRSRSICGGASSSRRRSSLRGSRRSGARTTCRRTAPCSAATSAVRLAEGRLREALAAAERAIEGRQTLGLGSQDVKQGYRNGLEAALALGDTRDRGPAASDRRGGADRAAASLSRGACGAVPGAPRGRCARGRSPVRGRRRQLRCDRRAVRGSGRPARARRVARSDRPARRG